MLLYEFSGRTRNDLGQLHRRLLDALLSASDNARDQAELLRLGRSKVARGESELVEERGVARHPREALQRANVGGETDVDFLCEQGTQI